MKTIRALQGVLVSLALSTSAHALVHGEPVPRSTPDTGTLAARLVPAMEAWVAPNTHAYYEPRATTDARYLRIATAIATVALDPDHEPLFGGPKGRERTAFLLASIASYESNFSRSIETCRKGGDSGRAWTLWQVHQPKGIACESLESGARLAVDMLRTSLHACADQAPKDRLAAYTDGVCRPSRASRERYSRAVTWLEAHDVG